VRDERTLRRRLDGRLERGKDALAVALSERNETNARRNEIGCDPVKKCVQRNLKRDPVTCGGNANRHRVGHGPSPGGSQPVECRTGPSRAGRLDEGRALRRGLQMALLRRRESDGKLSHGAQCLVVRVGQ